MGLLLLNIPMRDGSRQFASLPEAYDPEEPEWERLRDWVGRLSGARLTDFVTDQVTEAWIDFEYCCQKFSLNNQNGEWSFFASDPACPEDILRRVVDHFEAMLPRPTP